jgi:sarcosine oxidase subunit alpha
VRRLPTGGLIDRSRPIAFVFDGQEYEGYTGDTLASALLANDVMVVGRSPILGRPRGIMTSGPEEPCALVEITEPYVDIITPATMVPLEEGLVARPAASVARLPKGPLDRTRVRHRHVHVDTLVIGGGRSGLLRAERSAQTGKRVMLVDERHLLGGASRLLGERIFPSNEPFEVWIPRVASVLRDAGATVLTRAAALGVYDDGYVVIHERKLATDRLWHVRARRVVLATGAQSLPIAFRGNDRPGVMLAEAVQHYIDRYAVVPTGGVVEFQTAYSEVRTYRGLQLAGRSEGYTLVLPFADRPSVGTSLPYKLVDCVIDRTVGSPRLRGAVLSSGAEEKLVEAELVVMSGGTIPRLGLLRAAGGTPRYGKPHGLRLDAGSMPPWLEVVGEARFRESRRFPYLPVDASEQVVYPFVPADDLSEHFVDFQRDQTVADIARELDAGLRSVEHIKRATYIGTAVDQGRASSALAAEVVNTLLGSAPGAQGATSARPPWSPTPFDVFAGPYRGGLFDPVRTTPIHPWHTEHEAVFEDVGQWKRARYYPRDGENMDAAVLREGRAVRTSVGMMDASTLGKIDVVGPDAGVFLDRMYTNAMSTLGVGKIRYGLMLGLDGMAFDDGVAMRLAEDHYLVTTTTGGAARVLDRFEEWLQTEWPHLRVYCTSVTEQWATIAVAGPRAREPLAAAGTEIDLSNDAFPFMTWRDGTFAGVPARLARVSFSGELAVEVNVAAWHGLHVWEALVEAGEPFGLTAYGTEAMHVLRAEKGFAIVGQDTDGTVTPDDLGMSWIVNRKKGDFVGLRSLSRPDTVRAGRKQLVGLLPEDADFVAPEGAQLVPAEIDSQRRRSIGHVTSSYYGPGLGRSFALALLEGGADRHGETVLAPLAGDDVRATVASPILYDPDGARRDG